LVAVPSTGRATQVTPRRAAPEADATRDLYERYARQIYSYCLHQLGNREEAEDATQSTFLNAFRGFKRGVDPEFESAWLYKIAQNVCLTRQRSSSRRRKVEAPGDLEAMQDYVPAHQADSDELIRLPEALDAMPEQQRRALLLREWQGLSYKEIGEELELSQAAVETLLFRARRSLAAGLNEEPTKKSAGIAGRAGDLASLFSIVKSLLLTGGAKVATAVATVAATSVVAATPVTRHAVEQVVAPQPVTPVHHVSPQRAAARSSATARGGASLTLVSVHATERSTPRHATTLRAHRHAMRPSYATASAASSTPSASTPTVETPVAAPTAEPTVQAPAPEQPAATQPVAETPKPDAGGKDDSSAGRSTHGSGATPAAAQPAVVDVPATPSAKPNERSLASSSDGKKNEKNADKKDARIAPEISASVVTTTTAVVVTTTTPPTPAAPADPPPTTTTTPASPPPVVTDATPQQPQSSRPAEGHKPDGKGDNGGGANGNGKKK
jgi:RNA polymerase sigma factor (sigma-70 family)